MKDLQMRTLTDEELTAIYNSDMVCDFHPDELKPLAMIRAAIQRGEYAACGIFADKQRVGYAFFVQLPGMQLLDYFAVSPEKRGNGIGSRFLHLLAAQTNDCLLLETEDPTFIPDETAARRLRFYLRSGCRDTGVRAEIWGVPYRVLLLAGETGSPAEIYAELYRHMLPPQLFDTKVRIRTEPDG